MSYADFITVLFAMFVLMYVSAKAREQKVHLLTPQHEKRVAATTNVPDLLSDLHNRLALEERKGALTVFAEPRGVAISLDDRLCFKPGHADILGEAVPMFQKVGQALAARENRVLLEGHTDSVPIHNTRFQSNWELSTARSIAVMQVMEESAGLGAARFSIGGSADNAPVATNETEVGRAHNRRVEIIVLDTASTS